MNDHLPNPATTQHLPSERYDGPRIAAQAALFGRDGIAEHLLDAVPTPVLVINDRRQIVYTNRAVTAMACEQPIDELLGLRAGEALGCVNAAEAGDCGIRDVCRWCEIVSTLLGGLDGRETESECHISCLLAGQENALDLRVWSRPLSVAGERFAILALADISHEKRRKALEHTFFHDLMNSLGSVKGLIELAKSTESEEREELFDLMQIATAQAIDEITSQRLLVQAESRELQVDPDCFAPATWLADLVEIFTRYYLTGNKTLILSETPGAGVRIVSDRTLLRRILVNMIKNALEATPRGGTVKVGCRCDGAGYILWVHNDTAIPADHHSRIFKRSFSTRGNGRGTGTYSMKLLSRYLHGTVYFDSTPENGTTFYCAGPMALPGHYTKKRYT